MAKIKQTGPHLNTADRHEIYQEVLLAIFERAENKGFDVNIVILPYAMRIAHHKTVDFLRRLAAGRKAREKQQSETSRSSYEAVSITTQRETEEFLAKFRTAIATLPRRQRQVAEIMTKHRSEDLTNQQISELIAEEYGTNCTEQAVKSARQQLRSNSEHVIRQITEGRPHA